MGLLVKKLLVACVAADFCCCVFPHDFFLQDGAVVAHSVKQSVFSHGVSHCLGSSLTVAGKCLISSSIELRSGESVGAPDNGR